MKANHLLSPTRFFLLLRNELWMNAWGLLPFIGCMLLGSILLVSLLDAEELAFLGYTHVIMYPYMLCFGLIGTGYAFKELGKAEEAYSWLALPASLLEKYTIRAILTSIGYFLSTTLAYTAFAKTLEGLFRLRYSQSDIYVNPLDIPFSPFDSVVLDYLAVYITAHSIVLVGAVYFRSIAYVVVVLVIYELIGMTIFPAIDMGIADIHLEIIKSIGRFPFWWLIAPVCWVAGYHLLKKANV